MRTNDLDRLHEFCMHPDWTSRQNGKTTAMIYTLLGEIQLGDPKVIIILVHTIQDTQWLRAMIRGVLTEEGISILDRSHNTFTVRFTDGTETIEKEIRFIAANDEEALKGMDMPNTTVLNFDDYSKNTIPEEVEGEDGV